MDEGSLNGILTSRQSLYSYPGDKTLSGFYPNSDSLKMHLAPSSTSSGRSRVSGNNPAFGGITTFQISSSDILKGLQLNVQVRVVIPNINANTRHSVCQGFLYQMIESIECVFPASYASQQTLPGTLLYDYSLLCCRNREERRELLDAAGKYTVFGNNVTVDLEASIPIGLGLFNINSCGAPIDFSTLSGNVQVNVRFKGAGSFLMRSVVGGNGIPTSVTIRSCTMTARASQLALNSASVKASLAADPNASYNVPCNYLTFTRFTESLNPNAGEITRTYNITAAPNAMLDYLIVSPRLLSAINDTNTGLTDAVASVISPAKWLFPDRIHKLELTYDSQVLFKAESLNELRRYLQTCFDGDDLSYDVITPFQAVSADIPAYVAADAGARASGQVYAIPLCFDGDMVRSRKLRENIPSYASASLQLKVTWGAGGDNTFNKPMETHLANSYLPTYGLTAAAAGNVDYEILVGYICSSTLSMSSGGVEVLL